MKELVDLGAAQAILGRGDEAELGAAWERPVLAVAVTEGGDHGPPGDLVVPPQLPVVVAVVVRGRPPPSWPGGADIYLADEEEEGRGARWVAPAGGAEAGVGRIEAVAADHPYAATTLAQLLRVGLTLGRQQAVVAESLAFSALQAGADHRQWLARRPSREQPVLGPPLRLERDGDRLEITLTRPNRRNAVDASMRDALVEAFAVAELDPTVAEVRLRGEGASFSSGGDLVEFGTAIDPAVAHAVRTTRHAGLALAALRARTVVEVHGPCFGAGVEIPAFADHVIAAPDTTFSLPEVGMGLVPGAGGTVSIPRRIGPHRAAWLGLSGEALDAAAAARWGLVDEVRD